MLRNGNETDISQQFYPIIKIDIGKFLRPCPPLQPIFDSSQIEKVP